MTSSIASLRTIDAPTVGCILGGCDGAFDDERKVGNGGTVVTWSPTGNADAPGALRWDER